MDSQAAVEALFSDDIMTHFYTQQAFAGRPLEHLMRAFDGILDNFAKHGKRALNILEIGAGREYSDLPFRVLFNAASKVPAL